MALTLSSAFSAFFNDLLMSQFIRAAAESPSLSTQVLPGRGLAAAAEKRCQATIKRGSDKGMGDNLLQKERREEDGFQPTGQLPERQGERGNGETR